MAVAAGEAAAARPSARARAVPAASARRRPSLEREAAAEQAEDTRDPWLGWAARATLRRPGDGVTSGAPNPDVRGKRRKSPLDRPEGRAGERTAQARQGSRWHHGVPRSYRAGAAPEFSRRRRG